MIPRFPHQTVVERVSSAVELIVKPTAHFSNCCCASRNAERKGSHGSLLNQTVEDVSDLFRALLGVTLLAALVVHEGDTEARLISLSPFKVATQGR